MNRKKILQRRIKLLTWFFMVGLVVSGATAIPLCPEVDWLAKAVCAEFQFGGA